MKRLLFLFFILTAAISLHAQDIVGQWNGALKVQGIQLRIVFHITKTESGYSATMDSPDQQAKGIPVSSVTFNNSEIKLKVESLKIEYSGLYKDEEIIGTFKQGLFQSPMNLSKEIIAGAKLKRPQEPKKPYPYYTEEVSFQNPKAKKIKLSGTLSLPQKEGNYPAVVMITGSGAQNRDEEIFGHKPFLIIADHLTKNGIAVLRYDDRGYGESEGNFANATTADFATDVESAIAYLQTRKEINRNKIGLIGHSEGGVIAPMVAAKSNDVSFIVLLAGTGVRGDKLLLSQQEAIAKAMGFSEAEFKKAADLNREVYKMIEKSENDDQKLRKDLTNKINEALNNGLDLQLSQSGMTQEEYVSIQVNQVISPWTRYFLKLDPADALVKVKCPVLALNGEKDLQVPFTENLAAIENALNKGGNKQVTTIAFPDLNHLFQKCSTGLMNEYGEIEQTIEPKVLDGITKWIKTQTK